MKALVLTSSYPTRDGSFEGGFVADLTRNMRIHGIVPAVLAPHFPGGSFRESREGIRIYRFPYFFPLRFQRLAYGNGMPFNIHRDFSAFAGILPFCLMEFIWTLAVLFRERADLIHTHWLIPQGLIGALVQRITGIPHVATVHGSDLNILKEHVLLQSLGRFIVRNSTIITVNSTYMEKQILEIVPESHYKIRIIPMGVDPSAFMTGTGSEISIKKPARRIILSVGRLVDLKGIRFLIESLPAVLRAVPETDLVIIGTGPEKERLARRVHELSLDDHVRFLGAIRHDELAPYYQKADAFILPSLSFGSAAEGLGVVLLEAMAAGCPVIGSNVGGIPDIIIDGKNGYLVPERDPAMVADRIIRLLSDTGLAETCRANAYKTVEESFSWVRISGRFAAVYSEAAGNREISRSERS